jgi:magnesium chelatase family protein
MLFKTFSAAVFGIDAYLVETEVDVVPAYEGHFTVVGLPDIAVKESRERIRAAYQDLAAWFNDRLRVTDNPGDISRRSSSRDTKGGHFHSALPGTGPRPLMQRAHRQR